MGSNKVILEVDKGPNRGTRFELELRCYRAVGRAGGGDVTVQLSEHGDRALEPDDLKKLEAHLAKRTSWPAPPEEKPRIGAFRRGRDILVEDEQISRTHAMIFVDEEGPSIVDLQSTNGTMVNGAKVNDADLRDGDIINIGKTRFLVRSTSA